MHAIQRNSSSKIYDKEIVRMNSKNNNTSTKRSQATKNLVQNVQLYDRTHSDSFSEPYTGSHSSTIHWTSSKTDQRIKGNVQNGTEIQADKKSVSTNLCGCCKRWRSNLEPKESWFLLLFGILPVNILVGINFISFGMYYVEYVEHFQVNRSTAGVIVAIKTGVISIAGVFGSSLMKRMSPRAFSMIGGAALFVATMLNVFAVNIYMLYVTQGLMEGFGFSLLILNSSVLSQTHFDKNRVLGGGIAMLGYNIGHLIGSNLTTVLIETYGWRGAMLISAALYGNITALSATFWKPGDRTVDTPLDLKEKRCSKEDDSRTLMEQQLDETADDTESETNECKELCKDIFNFRYFKEVKFTLCCIGASLARYNTKTFIEHIPNKMVEMGLSRSNAASVISVFGITAIVMRILTTFVANIKGINRLIYYSTGVFIGCTGSFLTLIHSLKGHLFAAAVQGIQTGFTNTIQSVVIVDLMGVDKLAKSMALFTLTVQFVCLFAAPFGGYLFDATDNYDVPFMVAGCMTFVGAVIMFSVAIKHEINRRNQPNDEDVMEKNATSDKTCSQQPEDNNPIMASRSLERFDSTDSTNGKS